MSRRDCDAEDDFADVFNAHLTLADLAAFPIHVAWKMEKRGGRLTKVPYAATGRGLAKADDPNTWGTRAQAERRARMLLRDGEAGGIGVQLGKMPNGMNLGGLDLDSCRNPATGVFDSWAVGLTDRFNTYAEISPSGTGVKMLFFYKDGQLDRLRKAMGTTHTRSFKRGTGQHPPAIEFSISGKYFTVTEDVVPGYPLALATAAMDELLQLVERDGPAFARKAIHPQRTRDDSRSGRGFRLAIAIKSRGGSRADYVEAIAEDAELSDWADDERQVDRAWDRAPAFGLSAKGKPLANLANALSMMRTMPELIGLLRFDEMARTSMLMRPVPVFGDDVGSNFHEPRAFTDPDTIRLQEFLQQAGLAALSKDTTSNAADVIALENSFHPVRRWLRGLEWDELPRLETWLSRYMGAEDSPYTRTIGRMFLIGMVARVKIPGCKMDHILIVEGAQGAAKSTALSILGGQWFSDSMPDLRFGKDVSQHLRGKWLIEIPELEGMRKAEVTQLKAFLSRRVEQYRPSYGRREVMEERQCVFAGTTNDTEYLRDVTGNRRYWPVKVGSKIDIPALTRDRDQLFAEAWDALGWGEHWWPDRDFEQKYMRAEQERRREPDPWFEAIATAVEYEDCITVAQVAEEIGIPLSSLDRQKQMRIASCLRELGFSRRHRRTGWQWERTA